MQDNTIQYNARQYNIIQCNAIQHNAIQYNTIQHNTIQIKKDHKVSKYGFSIRIQQIKIIFQKK